MREIEFKYVPVGELRKNPWNTNKVSPDNEEKIRESLKRHSMFKPIIVRQVKGVPGYEIIGGEHRWEQAIELGLKTVPVANLGYIDEKQAKEIGVIDNARYGVDDALAFSELLRELGDVEDLQTFLPYGSADLDAIFNASSIALDDLEIDESFMREEEPEEEEVPEPVQKAPKTHTVMRFKVSLGDAERLTALIAKTQKDHGFTTADDLTNAGDALIHLLSPYLHSGAATVYTAGLEALDDVLNNTDDE